MDSTSQDIVDLLKEAARRLIERMKGLGDEEWQWQPLADDPRVTIRWRLDHIAQTLGEERNWEWLDGDTSQSPTSSQHSRLRLPLRASNPRSASSSR